jgi:hypothetical protein
MKSVMTQTRTCSTGAVDRAPYHREGVDTTRWKLWTLAVWHFVRSAPLTYTWLLILLYTTLVADSLNPQRLRWLLLNRSTNLHHLDTDPIRVLIASLFWTDGGSWLMYLVLFTIFVAPAERWLGRLRWLAAGLTAHVVATYVSEEFLNLEIEHHLAPARLINVRDIGVSYFLVGLVGVMSYRIARPWRWGYMAAAVLLFTVDLIIRSHFTQVGHLCALLVGFACYPVTLGRDPARWDPAHLWLLRTLRSRGADWWRLLHAGPPGTVPHEGA